MDSSQPILELNDVSVRREVTILDQVAWRVEEGEHWCILGANGSGKTSLLSVLAAYLAPTSGTISLCGDEYGQADWREVRTHVGVVSSALSQRLHGHVSAIDIVLSGKDASLNRHGEVDADDRAAAEHLLERLGCSYLAARAWRYLSQGERQRVLIARALMADYKVLFLDEPCAGLDPVARESFLQSLDTLGRHHAAPTLVLVTHHVEEIVPCFTHLLVLKAGGVLAAGPVDEVLTSPLLSEAFGATLSVQTDGRRYSLRYDNPATCRIDRF
jgi:iron complex transport system ATP-binding protein